MGFYSNGVGWVRIYFSRYPISSLSAHACKIWARSDGRVEKSVLQVYNRMTLSVATITSAIPIHTGHNYTFEVGGDLVMHMHGFIFVLFL